MPNAFAHHHSTFTSNRLTLRCSKFILKRISGFVVYLNIIERSNQLRVLLENN